MTFSKKELFRSSSVSAENWWACYIVNAPSNIRDQVGMGRFDPLKHKGGFFYSPIVCWTIDAYIGGEDCDGDATHVINGHIASGPEVNSATLANNFFTYLHSKEDLSKLRTFHGIAND